MDGLGGRELLYDVTYMWFLKKYNKLVNKEKKKRSRLTDTENKLELPMGREMEDRQYGGRGKQSYYGITLNHVCETFENC